MPARHGGIAIPNPTKISDREFASSQQATKPLTDLILANSSYLPSDAITEMSSLKKRIHRQNRSATQSAVDDLRPRLDDDLKRAIELASEKGASSWLTALPVTEHGFSLHKGAFHDALALRYSWHLSQTPIHCDCGSSFSIEHSLSCHKGGFPTLRLNEVRDLTARLLTEVCHDVRVEPHLQPLSGEAPTASSAISQDGARLDIEASGFWGGRFERTLIDVRVFNPHASSNHGNQLSSTYRRHENIKKRAYQQRIREVEQASFTPLIFSASGGMAREANTFYKRLASMLATKRDQPYSTTMTWMRFLLSFSLLRSAIQCIRGARSSIGNPTNTAPPCDLINREARLHQHA